MADYGPDAGSVSDTRGPNGRVEWNVLAEPGNYGWPYCVGDNAAYNDYNFASSTAGAAFNCANPRQRLAEQHRPDAAPAGEARGHVAEQQRLDHRHPGDRRQRCPR